MEETSGRVTRSKRAELRTLIASAEDDARGVGGDDDSDNGDGSVGVRNGDDDEEYNELDLDADDGDTTETEYYEDAAAFDIEDVGDSETESDEDIANADDSLYAMSQDRDIIRAMKLDGWSYGMRWPPFFGKWILLFLVY
ncbi:hypothetical protein BBJ28_00024899 [Nothophytophthora sp. Chile5]|nr:hypothetical protein BBJ28_00024899 [Nothophytophthora sp. Chile5]